MNPKRILWLLGLCLNVALLQGADQYESGDTLYVWAQSGLNVRSAPGVAAQKVGQLPLGAWVEIVEKTEEVYKNKVVDTQPDFYPADFIAEEEIPAAFYLHSHWVEIRSENFRGYVIDSYLLAYALPSEGMSLLAYFGFLEREAFTVDTTWNPSCDGAPIVQCYTYAGKSKQGFEVIGSYTMSAIDETIIIPNMTLEEGFVFASFFYRLEQNIRQANGRGNLLLVRNDAAHLWFMEDELCDFSFTVEDNRFIISHGCSC